MYEHIQLNLSYLYIIINKYSVFQVHRAISVMKHFRT